jgi:cytochrome P450
MTDQQIGLLSGGNLFAGSQSPYHVLDTICNFLIRNLSSQEHLYAEFTNTRCTYLAPLPAGIKVGIPSHGLSGRKDVLGDDADEFKPERWMRRQGESGDAFAKRRLAMERCDMTFGHGSRACIGKNIATLEL